LTNFTSESSKLTVRSTNFTVEMLELPGFLLPSNRVITVPEASRFTLQLWYQVVPPRLFFDRSLGLGVLGTSDTLYEIEAAPQPNATQAWSVVKTMTLSEGTNWSTGTGPSPISNRFYRARWLSE
jgi:hypothetical protein